MAREKKSTFMIFFFIYLPICKGSSLPRSTHHWFWYFFLLFRAFCRVLSLLCCLTLYEAYKDILLEQINLLLWVSKNHFYQHATDLNTFFHVRELFVECRLCCVVWHYMRPIIRSGSGPWIFIDATVFRPRDQLAAIEHILFSNRADVLIIHFFRPYDYLYVCLYARHKTVFRPTDPLAALDQMQLFIIKSVFFFFFFCEIILSAVYVYYY